MRKASTLFVTEQDETAGLLRRIFRRPRPRRTWLCTNCDHEMPRKLGFFDTG